MSGVKHPTDFKVKLTVKKVLEVSYSGKKGVKLAAALKKGPVTLRLDNEGNISSSAQFGRYSIKGFDSIKALGVKLKALKITAHLKENGDIAYKAGITYGLGSFFVSGSFDIEKLILDNSGLLGDAYRGIKNRDQQLQDALEHSGVR